MGAIELESDNPAVAERIAAIREGYIWAELGDDDHVDSGRIDIWFPSGANRHGALSDPLKEAGGLKVSNGGGTLPLNLTNCRVLRELYGDDLDISEGLNTWALDEIERLGAIENFASASSDAELDPRVAQELPALARMVHAYQRAGIAFLTHTRRALLADQPGLGKASPVSEPILTPSGWVKMGDIRVGDRVVGADGCPTEVLGVFPQGPREVVKVTFSDGTVVRCDWDHLWQVRTKDHRNAGLPGWTRSARELKEMGLYIENGTRKRFDIPMVAPVQFDSEPYPLDAYTVGVLIGDGSTSQRHGVWITTDHEIIQGMSLPKPASLTRDEGIYGDYFLPGLSRILRDLGLSEKKAEQKSIPEPLLRGSAEDRISLLQGLLDTDGTTVLSRGNSTGTTIEYGTVSRQLSEDVTELVQSLGGVVSVREKWPTYTHKEEKRVGQLYYRMVLSLPSGIVPFRLQRKLDRWTPRSKYEPSRSIVSIEGTGEYEQAQCIRVAAADSLYITTGYVVTHNTLQTVGAMSNAGIVGDILVAAPSAAVATTWPDELAMWAPNDECITVMGTGPKRHKILDALGDAPTDRRRWIIVNLEMLRCEWVKPTRVRRPHKRTGVMGWFEEPGWWDQKYPELFGHNWAAFIIDESHRCLICHSATPQSQTQVRAGAGMIPMADNGLKIALSGTPMRGKPENLWGTLNWLYPDKYHAYWTWAQQWFHVLGDVRSQGKGAGNVEIAGLDESKAKLFYEDIAPIMLRRTKKEVRSELPDKLYAGTPLAYPDGTFDEHNPIGHWLQMSPKQAKAYHEIAEQAETILESGVLTANGVLAELTRLKQFAICYGDVEEYIDSKGNEAYRFLPKLPSTKFDWLVEFLDSLGINRHSSMEPDEDEEERKVVVASQFTGILDMYERELKKLGIECLKITGKVSQAQRKANKDRWQERGGPRVFLLNTQAGGVSLTLDAADDLVFLDETWIPDDQEQVEDRIHRVSRLHQVTIHYLRTLETVEENIALTAGSRERLTKLLIDGQRGITFAKALLTPIRREKAA